MGFEFITVEEAMARSGLRMVVVGNVPSPWGEAAKGILHVKGIDWAAIRLDYASEALPQWTGGLRNGPIAFHADERPRAGWSEILLLAERLAPRPSLLPKDPAMRAVAFGLAHEICGEEGLSWSRRLQLVHAGLNDAGGFPPKVSKYLGRKYGYIAESGAHTGKRVVELLNMLAARLKAQHEGGSRYYVGNELTAVDIYSATAMALFAPLGEDDCAMDPVTRAAFETLDEQTRAALDPVLLEHRAEMYAKHLALPLSL